MGRLIEIDELQQGGFAVRYDGNIISEGRLNPTGVLLTLAGLLNCGPQQVKMNAIRRMEGHHYVLGCKALSDAARADDTIRSLELVETSGPQVNCPNGHADAKWRTLRRVDTKAPLNQWCSCGECVNLGNWPASIAEARQLTGLPRFKRGKQITLIDAE